MSIVMSPEEFEYFKKQDTFSNYKIEEQKNPASGALEYKAIPTTPVVKADGTFSTP